MSVKKIDDDMRLLAALAYGEASTADDSDEIGGIAFAVANRFAHGEEKLYPH